MIEIPRRFTPGPAWGHLGFFTGEAQGASRMPGGKVYPLGRAPDPAPCNVVRT